MRMGSSPLYLLEGQEEKLENEVENLKSMEKEAYLKLKKEKILIDENEEPSIRVALRNIKDFAVPFEFNEKIMWKYVFTPQEELEKILNPKTEEESEKQENIQKAKEKESKKRKKEKIDKVDSIFEEKEDKPEPKFLTEVKDFLKNKKIEFLEEIKTEKKEIVAKININTILGDIKFLLIAKNKQTITKEEINSALQQAVYNNTPCLILLRKEPNSSIKKILKENYIIKLEVMDK